MNKVFKVATNLATPNRLIGEYFSTLRSLVEQTVGDKEKKNIQRKVVLCIFMSVAIIETFLNFYFRQLIEESDYSGCREQTLKELDEKTSLDIKIRAWPKRFFNKDIDFSQGIGQRFMDLKRLRNSLMHFKSSYDTVKSPDGEIEIRGLVDVSSYKTLDKKIAIESLNIAEEMIAEIFRLKGFDNKQISHYLHLWARKIR